MKDNDSRVILSQVLKVQKTGLLESLEVIDFRKYYTTSEVNVYAAGVDKGSILVRER